MESLLIILGTLTVVAVLAFFLSRSENAKKRSWDFDPSQIPPPPDSKIPPLPQRKSHTEEKYVSTHRFQMKDGNFCSGYKKGRDYYNDDGMDISLLILGYILLSDWNGNDSLFETYEHTTDLFEETSTEQFGYGEEPIETLSDINADADDDIAAAYIYTQQESNTDYNESDTDYDSFGNSDTDYNSNNLFGSGTDTDYDSFEGSETEYDLGGSFGGTDDSNFEIGNGFNSDSGNDW